MRLTLFLLLCSFISRGQNCSYIKKETDKFTGNINFSAPYSNALNFYKTIRNGDTTILITLHTYGITANAGKQGVIILLSDSNKLEFPRTNIDIDVNITGQGYDYSATVLLSKYEISLLLNSPITDYRLYIHDRNLSKYEGKAYRKTLQCLLTAK